MENSCGRSHRGRFNRKPSPLNSVEQENSPLAAHRLPEQFTQAALGGQAGLHEEGRTPLSSCGEEVIEVVVLTCEVCGNPIRTSPSRVEIDGAILQVCQSCAKRGSPLMSAVPRVRPFRTRPAVRGESIESELEVDPEYSSIVRRAREKLGLTQEALGRAINVKPSVISHIETKKMKPDLILARTLMHYLKVNLLISSNDLDSALP